LILNTVHLASYLIYNYQLWGPVASVVNTNSKFRQARLIMMDACLVALHRRL